MNSRQPDTLPDADRSGTHPPRPPRARLLVALAAPSVVMLVLHRLGQSFGVAGDSPLAWAGGACAALLMAGAVALGQAGPARPAPRRAPRPR